MSARLPARVQHPRAPRPDDDVRLAARAAIAGGVEALLREQRGARAGDVEGIHRLRVAMRRLRAALRLFAPVVPAALGRSADATLASLGRTVGAVRDADVLALAIAARARRLDVAMRGALEPVVQTVAARRAAALAGVAPALDAARARNTIARLQAFVERRPAAGRVRRLADEAPALLRPLRRDVRRAGHGFDADMPAERLHRLRVRIKRLRYAYDILAGLDADAVARASRRLARFQDVVGNLRDATAHAAWLRAQATTAAWPPDTLLAAGALVHELERRAAKMRGRLPRAWRRLQTKRLRRVLHAPAPSPPPTEAQA